MAGVSGAGGRRHAATRPLLVLAIAALLLPLLAACGPAAKIPATTVKPTGADNYPHPEYLADTGWLADRLGDRFIRIVDLSPLEEYERGHLPGAVHVWWQDLIEVNNGTYGMLVDPAGRKRVFEAAGIEEGDDGRRLRQRRRALRRPLPLDPPLHRLRRRATPQRRLCDLAGGGSPDDARRVRRSPLPPPGSRPARGIPDQRRRSPARSRGAGLRGDRYAHPRGRAADLVRRVALRAHPRRALDPWDRNLAQKNTAIVRDPAELAGGSTPSRRSRRISGSPSTA